LVLDGSIAKLDVGLGFEMEAVTRDHRLEALEGVAIAAREALMA
jgi:hypothetical protein